MNSNCLALSNRKGMDSYLNSVIEKGYRLDTCLEHSEIIPFVQQNLKRRTASAVFYWLINIVLFAVVIWRIIATTASLDNALTNFGLGIFVCFFLIPIHELIHGLTYSALGAQTVSYKADFRKLVFYAMADKFIVNANQFRLVALAPFVPITTSLLIVYFNVPESASFIVLGALLFHTAACSGDFGLLSYFDHLKKVPAITYDDAETGRSYFLTRDDDRSKLN